ncbi:MAG: carboxymuconolactone decarboxylase family protein [Halioglobus sp.]|nr:carboxymuconolactone decarboxylase family protein [Halioglobus sp.]
MSRERPPDTYLSIRQRHQKLAKAVEDLGKAAKSAGPVDEQTAQLIQLAAAATLRSEGAVHSHTRRALEAGADAEAIRHAIILLTSTVGFPTVVAALSWADDVIDAGR